MLLATSLTLSGCVEHNAPEGNTSSMPTPTPTPAPTPIHNATDTDDKNHGGGQVQHPTDGMTPEQRQDWYFSIYYPDINMYPELSDLPAGTVPGPDGSDSFFGSIIPSGGSGRHRRFGGILLEKTIRI